MNKQYPTLAEMMKSLYLPLDYPTLTKPGERAPITSYEGGDRSTKTMFAIRLDAGSQVNMDGSFVDSVSADFTGFTRGGKTVDDARLFDTADEAASAIATRNARNAPTLHKYSIVPVTVTETAARIKVVTTEIPAKTIYHVRDVYTDSLVWVIPGTGFGWIALNGSGEKPTEFASANDAANAIKTRNDLRSYSRKFVIEPVEIPGSKTVLKSVAAPASRAVSL
jgi:hypothetical protein